MTAETPLALPWRTDGDDDEPGLDIVDANGDLIANVHSREAAIVEAVNSTPAE